MKISEVVNKYGKIYSPYASGLVNHLPMGQLALYMMGNGVDKVASYSENYVSRGRLDRVKDEVVELEDINQCLGNRELYESCLVLIKNEIQVKGVNKVIEETLNKYPLGLSSGLFHTTIRLAYAVEGMNIERELIDEVVRALAYYITGYREGKVFLKRVKPSEFKAEVEKLFRDPHINGLMDAQPSRDKKLHALYSDPQYLDMAPLINGNIGEKVSNLLEVLLPIFDKTNDIAVLHCITGLHAVLVLQNYFQDFDYVLDIMTSYIITHLLTVDRGAEAGGVDLEETPYLDWDNIIEKASNSSNVHTIKFTYSSGRLYDRFGISDLIQSANMRTLRN